MRSAATQSTVHYTRQPLWWLGLGLMVLGEVGNFSAFGFAPASLVAPLGTTTVIGGVLLQSYIYCIHIFIKCIFCLDFLSLG